MEQVSATTILRLLKRASACPITTLCSSSNGAYHLEYYWVHPIILSFEICNATSAPPLCFKTPAPFVLKLNCTPNTMIALTFYYYAK